MSNLINVSTPYSIILLGLLACLLSVNNGVRAVVKGWQLNTDARSCVLDCVDARPRRLLIYRTDQLRLRSAVRSGSFAFAFGRGVFRISVLRVVIGWAWFLICKLGITHILPGKWCLFRSKHGIARLCRIGI